MSETDRLILPQENKNSSSDNERNFPSLGTLLRDGYILENTGSTARDHLANERTYLAWIRTALAITGVGLGLLKWNGIADVEAYLVLILGVTVLVTSTQRYLHVMKNLSQQKFEPNVRSILGMVGSILVVVVALIVLHFADKLG